MLLGSFDDIVDTENSRGKVSNDLAIPIKKGRYLNTKRMIRSFDMVGRVKLSAGSVGQIDG